MDFNMYVPTKILFGAGTLNELGKQQLPGKKAVIIISNGKSTRANGYLSRTEEQLAQAGVATSVFDKIQPNPLKETVMEGAAFVKAQGADFIVALGGGHRQRSRRRLRYYQPRNKRKSRPENAGPVPRTVHRRPGTDEKRTSTLHCLSGLRCSQPQP